METQIVVVAALSVNLLAIGAGIWKLGTAVGKFELIGRQQAMEIKELKKSVEGIGDLVTKMAVQTQRQDSFAERLNRYERMIDDLRRGEGFILPTTPRS